MQHRSISRAARNDSVTAPLWTATAAPGPVLAPLAGHVQTDILVIGGGIAGPATALHSCRSPTRNERSVAKSGRTSSIKVTRPPSFDSAMRY